MKLSSLTSKDVINDADGNKLGKIQDAEIDPLTGRITSVKINNGFKFTSFLNNKSALNVPWNRIIKIGGDVIIVDIDENVPKVKEENK
jgi:YlmC/YmxH family sporulation protein